MNRISAGWPIGAIDIFSVGNARWEVRFNGDGRWAQGYFQASEEAIRGLYLLIPRVVSVPEPRQTVDVRVVVEAPPAAIVTAAGPGGEHEDIKAGLRRPLR